jgi:uncharacterized membrane protein
MLKKLATIAVIMLLLDSIYLTVNKTMLINQIVSVQRTTMQMRFMSAIACYVFLVGGLYYFIIKNHRSVMDAFILGLVIYGVYETTTYAVFKNWSPYVVIIDTLWGGILLALTTHITYQL